MKECPWCGGKYNKGHEVARSAKIRRSDPSSYCSVQCWWANTYKSSLGWTAVLLSAGIIFSVLYFVSPSVFQVSFPLDTIILIVAGFGCGLPSLCMTNRTRAIRRDLPKDSRRGQRIDEPLEEFRTY